MTIVLQLSTVLAVAREPSLNPRAATVLFLEHFINGRTPSLTFQKWTSNYTYVEVNFVASINTYKCIEFGPPPAHLNRDTLTCLYNIILAGVPVGGKLSVCLICMK